MARVTNSDTLPFVDSRYELGMLTAQRVRTLKSGADKPVVEKTNDKLPVVALREIATGKLDIANIRQTLIDTYKDNTTISENEFTSEQTEETQNTELDGILAGEVVAPEESEDELEEPTQDEE